MELVLHGGAGVISRDHFSQEELMAYESSLAKILETGNKSLRAGKSALDICVECVALFEDDPLFNAGRGSVYNSAGDIEMDASLMCGRSQNGAGVSGLRSIQNPIQCAREILTDGRHVFLAGEGAENFSHQKGLATCEPSYFQTEKRYQQFLKFQKNQRATLDHGGGHTVGAVCRDRDGHLAAATSTGGMTGKLPGRVSDSAIIGVGTFADDQTVGLSATGTGDHFIRMSFGHEVHAKMKYQNLSLDRALELTLDELKEIGGVGGAVAISSCGEIAMPFNSGGMFRASINDSGAKQIAIFSS